MNNHLPTITTTPKQEGQCFDYFFDTQSLSFQSWAQRVPKYVPMAIGGGPGETAFAQLAVPTVDTVGWVRLEGCMHCSVGSLLTSLCKSTGAPELPHRPPG